MSEFKRVRILETIRTFHTEFSSEDESPSIGYFKRSYDLTLSRRALEALGHKQLSLLSLPVWLIRKRPRQIELNEPAMVGAWTTVLPCYLICWVYSRLAPQPVMLTTYAIENLNWGPALAKKLHITERLAGKIVGLGVRFASSRLDRMAYGSPAAELSYREFQMRSSKLETATILQLPSPCFECCPSEGAERTASVIFLGSFEARKGILDLLQAWELIATECPTASLTLAGKGPLLPVVEDFASSHTSVIIYKNPPRDKQHELLRAATVLCLPSRSGRNWKEQIGLPILEGLAHGCAIVSTEGTGLADWLDKNGHGVANERNPKDLAKEILNQLAHKRSATSIQASLPQIHGRLTADRWLARKSTPKRKQES